MNRREALKSIGIGTGFAILSTPILSMLHSCTAEKQNWTPEFLSVEEGKFVTRVVDIIIPKTEGLPSATEVNVPQFIDSYWKEVLDEEEQKKQKNAISKMLTDLNTKFNENLDDLTEAQYKEILDKYILSKGDIDPQRDANPNNSDFVTDYEFLNGLKWMTINAYIGSEQIGENVLNYDPIPAQYYCGDLQELTGGRSNSL